MARYMTTSQVCEALGLTYKELERMISRLAIRPLLLKGPTGRRTRYYLGQQVTKLRVALRLSREAGWPTADIRCVIHNHRVDSDRLDSSHYPEGG